MKSLSIYIILFLFISLTQTISFAQSKIITDTVTVSGNCNQCKDRIEDAAYIKGVKDARWDQKTKILTVSYNTEKTSLDKIEMAVAKAGHDTHKYKAADKEYKKLPSCCLYRDKNSEHD